MVRYTCENAESALFDAGSYVCRRGHVADSMFFVVAGELEVDVETLSTRMGVSTEQEFSTDIVSRIRIKPNCWVGDKGMFIDTEAKRQCSLTAVINTEILIVRYIPTLILPPS